MSILVCEMPICTNLYSNDPLKYYAVMLNIGFTPDYLLYTGLKPKVLAPDVQSYATSHTFMVQSKMAYVVFSSSHSELMDGVYKLADKKYKLQGVMSDLGIVYGGWTSTGISVSGRVKAVGGNIREGIRRAIFAPSKFAFNKAIREAPTKEEKNLFLHISDAITPSSTAFENPFAGSTYDHPKGFLAAIMNSSDLPVGEIPTGGIKKQMGRNILITQIRSHLDHRVEKQKPYTTLD